MNERPPKIGNLQGIERKEEPKGREIDFYLLRHAEASGESIEAGLTEQGVRQAKKTGESLLEQILKKGGGVIKFLSSPVERAKQTAQGMQSTIQEKIVGQEIKNVRLMSLREHEALRSAGVIAPLKQQGVKDPIEHWFQNPESVEGISPKQTAERLQEVINFLKELADRLPAGEKIYYIGVTHEVPQATLLHQVSGRTLNELGGNIENCEPMLIEIKGKS